MESTATDIAPVQWTDEEWKSNLRRVFDVLMVIRGMRPLDVADAMGTPRSTFYDKLKKGSFTAIELRHAAEALAVPAAVFYEPADYLLTAAIGPRSRTGSFSSELMAMPVVTGQGALLNPDLTVVDFYARPFLSLV